MSDNLKENWLILIGAIDAPGKKIRILAKIIEWIFLILGALIGLILLSNGHEYHGEYEYNTEDDLIGWTALIIGFGGVIFSWFLSGFGHIVEDVHAIRLRSETMNSKKGKKHC